MKGDQDSNCSFGFNDSEVKNSLWNGHLRALLTLIFGAMNSILFYKLQGLHASILVFDISFSGHILCSEPLWISFANSNICVYSNELYWGGSKINVHCQQFVIQEWKNIK